MKNSILILLVFISISSGLLFSLILGYCMWFIKPNLNTMPGIQIYDMSYKATLDDIFPLFALVCYRKNAAHLPVLVIMHEYTEINDRYSLMETAKRFAEKDFFVIVPDMRGRGRYAERNLVQYNINSLSVPSLLKRIILKIYSGISSRGIFIKPSSGKSDSSGKEIHDIYDAVEFVKKNYNEIVDGSNINIIGYSGGGGNVLAAITKSPDYFNVAVSYFGISDYKSWYEATNSADIKHQLISDLGGTPNEVPDKYQIRNFIEAAGNNESTMIFLFVDEEDRLTPKWQSEAFHSKSAKSKLYLSRRQDPIRYMHGRPSQVPDIIESENAFVLRMKQSSPKKEPTDRVFLANGFLYYKNITVLFGSGDDSMFKVKWIEEGNSERIIPSVLTGKSEGVVILHDAGEYNVCVYENQKEALEATTLDKHKLAFKIKSDKEYKITRLK
ncbi:prolyl oligopeptidase family serine peptidase [Candidatus Parcubacteria bacterium]|nr:prolyl oligopeptidase family serine peptidase [Candidatus Parcubacteria bacterium]